jgi:uncharacterized membrane protein HdeD (DUF308 family)
MARRWREQSVGADFGADDLRTWTFDVPLTDQEVHRAGTWLTVSGILATLAGVVSIAVPIVASVTVAVLVGWALVLGAIGLGIGAVSDRWPWRFVEAVVTLIAGLYILLFPLSGTVTLTFVLAVWFLASGVASLVRAWEWRNTMTGWSGVLGGLLSLILGFLVAVSLPGSAAWVIGLMVGVELIFLGVRAVVSGQLLRAGRHARG